MSEEAGAEGTAAERAHRSKTDVCQASFVFVLPQNRTRLEESRSFLIVCFLLSNELMNRWRLYAKANRPVRDAISHFSARSKDTKHAFVSNYRSMMGLRDHMAAEETPGRV